MSVVYLCDSDTENCVASGELVVRPDSGAFFTLIAIYLGEIVAPLGSLLLTLFLDLDLNASGAGGFESLIWLAPSYLNFFAFGFTFMLQMIYWLLDFPAWLTRVWLEYIISGYTWSWVLAYIGFTALLT